MSTYRKLTVVGLLLVLSLVSLAGCSLRSDAGSVNTAAAKIADFTLPAGYTPEATAEISGYLFVSYAPGDGHSHIQLIQAPANAAVDRATLEHYIQQASQNRGHDPNTRSQVVDSRQAVIRGQPVTLVVSEATNSDHQPYRSLTGAFQGKGGAALLSVEAPVSSWNQAAIDQFLASIS